MKHRPGQKRQRETKVASWRSYCQQALKIETLPHKPLAYGSAAYVENSFIPDAALSVGQEYHDRRSTMHVSKSCKYYGLFCLEQFRTFQYSSANP